MFNFVAEYNNKKLNKQIQKQVQKCTSRKLAERQEKWYFSSVSSKISKKTTFSFVRSSKPKRSATDVGFALKLQFYWRKKLHIYCCLKLN